MKVLTEYGFFKGQFFFSCENGWLYISLGENYSFFFCQLTGFPVSCSKLCKINKTRVCMF